MDKSVEKVRGGDQEQILHGPAASQGKPVNREDQRKEKEEDMIRKRHTGRVLSFQCGVHTEKSDAERVEKVEENSRRTTSLRSAMTSNWMAESPNKTAFTTGSPSGLFFQAFCSSCNCIAKLF